MIRTAIKNNKQRGEVAWFLTIISMATVALGLVIGLSTTTSDQFLTRSTDAVVITEENKYKGVNDVVPKPVSRVDGQFYSASGICKASFYTQVDPPIQDILIARPQSLDFPKPGADVFSLIQDGQLDRNFINIPFVKNYSIIVRFHPNDPDKNTPNPRDIEVTYKVPSQPDKIYIVDSTKVNIPDWVYSSNTTVYLLWHPSKTNNSVYRFNTANSQACTTPTPTDEITPTETLTPTMTPTGTLTPTETPTPTPTGTITDEPGACYDVCTTNAQCGSHIDPATGRNAQMLCLKRERNPVPLSSTSFFPLDEGFSTQFAGEYPFTADSVIEDNATRTTVAAIPGLRWSNTADVSGDFEYQGEARVYWETQEVPSELQDKTYNISLVNFPFDQYEIVDTFCQNLDTPDTCAQFSTSSDKTTIFGISILRYGKVKYGWRIQEKSQATPIPTSTPVPPTSVPAPTRESQNFIYNVQIVGDLENPNDYFEFTAESCLTEGNNYYTGCRDREGVSPRTFRFDAANRDRFIVAQTINAKDNQRGRLLHGYYSNGSTKDNSKVEVQYGVVGTTCRNTTGLGVSCPINGNTVVVNVLYKLPSAYPTVCQQILTKVPASVIAGAIANPSAIPGWSPTQRNLTLQNINAPFNPGSNPVVFKAACENPTAPQPTVQPTGAPTAAPSNPGGHSICDPSTGQECRCMPPSCTGRDCSTRELACEQPTPTLTPTPSQFTAQCVYNAIAFVEQCQNINPITGECLPIPGTGRYDATPILDGEVKKQNPIWKMWAPQNNRQAANSLANRPESERPPLPQQFGFIARSMPAFDQLLTTFTKFNFARNNTDGITISPRQYSIQDVDVLNGRELLQPRTDIKIASADEIRRAVPAGTEDKYIDEEQYNNMEDASVQLFYDKDNYRILPKGKKIYSCTNSVAQELLDSGQLDPATELNIINMTMGTNACDIAEFNANPNRDVIDGLTVGCGQDIVYGWTLDKCDFNFDYVFVVDTSTSMLVPDPNLGGQRKIDAAVDQLDTFITNIENSGTDSRVALVNFNNAVHVYDNNRNIKDTDGDGYGNGIQTPGLVGRAEFDTVKSKFDSFRKTKEQGGLIEKGTCTKCGLDLAYQLLQEKRSDDEKVARAGVVIFLTDGLPNAYPGDAAPELLALYPPGARNNVVPWGWSGIYESADYLRNDGGTTPSQGVRNIGRNANVFDDVLLISVGYGDATIREGKGQDFEQFIYSISSLKAGGPERWAYSTDRTLGGAINIPQIFAEVQQDVNTCSLSQLAYDVSLRARDINKDGIVNTIDLFLIYENYYAEGDIPEDVMPDQVVNALDASLVLESLGTVVDSELEN